MNGAQLLTESLRRAGVSTIFSLSGNQIMPIYDACLDSQLRLIHTRHENAAMYMADAYAQVTGEIGVALVTAGPGFANALSALYSAQLNEAPVLLLSGDSPVALDGKGAFQEMDQVSMATPACKMSVRPSNAKELAEVLPWAIRAAQEYPLGPVHIALPADVLTGAADGIELPKLGAFIPLSAPPSPEGLHAIEDAMSRAKRPLILTGPHLNPGRADGMLSKLADALDAPVVTIESPRGLCDPASGALADILPKADLVLSLGKDFDFAVGFGEPLATDAALIFVSPESEAVHRAEHAANGRSVTVVQADPRATAEELTQLTPPAERTEWRAEVTNALAYRGDDRAFTHPGAKLNPGPLCAAVQHVLDEANDPILCIDGGEFGQWAQSILTAPTRIINGLSGAIGGGLAYAMAAKVARPDATVIVLMGDGTAGFHLSEFETMARESLNIIAIIGNDAVRNAEHQIQLREFGESRTHSCDMLETARYDRVAEALGCYGAHVTEQSAFEGALRGALASGRPAVIDVAINSIGAPMNSLG